MSEELRERSQIEEQYKWDLTTLFKNDEEWEKALTALNEDIEKGASFQGTLKDAASVKAFLDWETEAGRKITDVYVYASMRHDEDTRDGKATGMNSRAMAAYVQFSAATAYAQPEILALPEETLETIIADETLADYKFMLEDLKRNKPHTLSAKEEILLSSFGESFAAAGETADSLRDSDHVFEPALDSEGKEHEVTESSYIPLQMSADRTLRENAFKSYYKTYNQHIHTFASAYAGTVATAVTEAKVRGFESSRQMSMFSDNIPTSVYDNLIEVVHKRMDLMYRYLRLRKKLLGVEDLHYYDVYAHLSANVQKKFTYDEAKQMVLDATAVLGKEYTDRVQEAYDNRWIDVYPNKGKRGGAYSGGSYDSNPFILSNFNGELDSVSTIAHEMGHSQHSWLTNHNQPPHYADYSLFVAEVASTVNENLLIEQLLNNCDEPHERLALLNQYMEGFKGTVYRQTMFAEFEKEAHAMKERGESLNSETLSELYGRLIKLYFGEDLVMDEEVKLEWARIPHFYRPFYVYVYATGFTSAVALSEGILHDGEAAVKKYLEFLSMGSSQYPLDELAHGGVDLRTPDPIDRALDKFERILEDAEATAAKILG